MEGAGLYMTIEEMRELLTKDEKITVEYKACQNGIHDDVYETVCSFSNRYGGYIIMGVEDGGKPIGINKKLIKDMKKNFVNQLNNPDKMSPTLYLSIEEIEYEGMTLLWILCHQHQLWKNVQTEFTIVMKMAIWILRILLFSCRICITEKVTLMLREKYFLMLQQQI